MGRMSDDEIEKMIRDAKKYADADKKVLCLRADAFVCDIDLRVWVYFCVAIVVSGNGSWYDGI